MRDKIIEAMARAYCGWDVEWRNCTTPCMQANACAGKMNEYELARMSVAFDAAISLLMSEAETNHDMTQTVCKPMQDRDPFVKTFTMMLTEAAKPCGRG